MAQQTKVELLLQLKDRISSGITKAKETMSRNNQEMRQSIERLKKTKERLLYNLSL